jgi:hypothetical protein
MNYLQTRCTLKGTLVPMTYLIFPVLISRYIYQLSLKTYTILHLNIYIYIYIYGTGSHRQAQYMNEKKDIYIPANLNNKFKESKC